MTEIEKAVEVLSRYGELELHLDEELCIGKTTFHTVRAWRSQELNRPLISGIDIGGQRHSLEQADLENLQLKRR